MQDCRKVGFIYIIYEREAYGGITSIKTKGVGDCYQFSWYFATPPVSTSAALPHDTIQRAYLMDQLTLPFMFTSIPGVPRRHSTQVV